MKKSVVLLISLVYIISVVIVGVLGLKMRVYDEVVYVTDIKVSIRDFDKLEGAVYAENVKDPENPDRLLYNYYYYIKYTDKEIKLEIQSNVEPVESTYSHVTYYIGAGQENYVTLETSTDNNIAVVTFYKPRFLIINVQSTDGKKLQKSIAVNVGVI